MSQSVTADDRGDKGDRGDVGDDRTGARFAVTGIVQGVGFRPFVHRLATELGLDGEVGNDAAGVFIRVIGHPDALDEFERRLSDDAPPLSSIERCERTDDRDIDARSGFRIVASRQGDGERTMVAPDTAVCDDCLAELFDPTDRRYLHPFITCTNCGPRFTIVRSLPYDRPATTMTGFAMCSACATEYGDPSNRRYHAQPIGCHDCGPRLSASRPGNPIDAALKALWGGQTVAMKGLGGYHLMCDATDDEALARLRVRKTRADKPFAVLVADLDMARRLAEVTTSEADLLASPARPIVLVTARHDSPISELVAPGNPLIGLMLAYTPVHHLLFAKGLGPAVCTSANRAGEPLVYRDADAAVVLDPTRDNALCDVVIGHDRPIEAPCDDSVIRVVGDRLLPIRRGRGYAPVPVPFNGSGRHVLAVGGEMKSTCCVATADHGWVSQHVGEQGSLASLEAFEGIVEQFLDMYAVEPDVIAVDGHPGYSTARWARRRAGAEADQRTRPAIVADPAIFSTTVPEIVEVQHHHAHVAAAMAEHGLDPAQNVLGVTFDGTGYGTDGTIWGGEVLRANAREFERVAHLATVSLPGGDAAITNPYRVALAHLDHAGVTWDDSLAPVRSLVADGPVAADLFRRQLDTGLASIPTSSMGRLFDAVAALIGCRQRISFEAQAAIELELLAASDTSVQVEPPAAQVEPPTPASGRYRFGFDRPAAGPIVFDAAPIVRRIVDDLHTGAARETIAAEFHLAVVELIAELVARLRHDDEPVVLTGGVFQNAFLVERVIARLELDRVVPLTHHRVPPNDGGLALGQAFVAAHAPLAGSVAANSTSARSPMKVV